MGIANINFATLGAHTFCVTRPIMCCITDDDNKLKVKAVTAFKFSQT